MIKMGIEDKLDIIESNTQKWHELWYSDNPDNDKLKSLALETEKYVKWIIRDYESMIALIESIMDEVISLRIENKSNKKLIEDLESTVIFYRDLYHDSEESKSE